MVVTPRPRILITHPGRQHSHQAALGLASADMLAGYWSGVPSVGTQARLVPERFRRRYTLLPLAPELARAAPWTPAMRRIGDRLPHSVAARIDLLACRLFDHWVAAALPAARAQAVIACEISALATFRAARRLGMITILDAPSIHHLAQDRVQPSLDPLPVHRRLADIKDTEVALADHVLTVSELARASYVAGGVSPAKVHAVTLGADPAIFEAGGDECNQRGDADPIVFLFAGASIRRKGFDLLLDAFARVRSTCPAARLRVVGPAGDATSLLAATGAGIEAIGAVDQPTLARELRRADCLVLPSRHDSFGMVVVEALASGTPVLVSEMVGAKDLVEEGVNGWVVPLGDVAALAERMCWCAANPAIVRAARAASFRSARSATWDSYHRRLVTLLAGLCDAGRAAETESPAPQDAVA
jgi:glycosyltransferase involved in cell wall biosynthesis